MTPIHCPTCRHALGAMRQDGRFEMRHRGREIVCPPPDQITCERCRSTTPPDLAARLKALARNEPEGAEAAGLVRVGQVAATP